MSSLIFNHITTPVGRAGGAILILPIIAVAFFLALKALALPQPASLFVGGFLLCTVLLAVRHLTLTVNGPPKGESWNVSRLNCSGRCSFR
jgi:hypothetical protein